jgi:hypothetical protein
LSLANEDLFLGVELINAEFVSMLCFQGTAHRKKFSITSSELLKDIPTTFSVRC